MVLAMNCSSNHGVISLIIPAVATISFRRDWQAGDDLRAAALTYEGGKARIPEQTAWPLSSVARAMPELCLEACGAATTRPVSVEWRVLIPRRRFVGNDAECRQ